MLEVTWFKWNEMKQHVSYNNMSNNLKCIILLWCQISTKLAYLNSESVCPHRIVTVGPILKTSCSDPSYYCKSKVRHLAESSWCVVLPVIKRIQLYSMRTFVSEPRQPDLRYIRIYIICTLILFGPRYAYAYPTRDLRVGCVLVFHDFQVYSHDFRTYLIVLIFLRCTWSYLRVGRT